MYFRCSIDVLNYMFCGHFPQGIICYCYPYKPKVVTGQNSVYFNLEKKYIPVDSCDLDEIKYSKYSL